MYDYDPNNNTRHVQRGKFYTLARIYGTQTFSEWPL